MKKRYDKDQEGWRVASGLDQHGLLDFLVSHHAEIAWLFKLKPISPIEFLSLGIEAKTFDQRVVEELMQRGQPFYFLSQTRVDKHRILQMRGTGRFKHPRSLRRLKAAISEKHADLDRRLRNALEELFRKLYPERHMVI